MRGLEKMQRSYLRSILYIHLYFEKSLGKLCLAELLCYLHFFPPLEDKILFILYDI